MGDRKSHPNWLDMVNNLTSSTGRILSLVLSWAAAHHRQGGGTIPEALVRKLTHPQHFNLSIAL